MKPKQPVILALLLVLFSPVMAQADKVDEYIKAEMKRRQIPGLALAVVKNGKVIKMKGYGLASVELNVPVTPDSVFELASLTKPFTATAIMMLVEEGKVGLDDKISKYLTNAPDSWSGITVRHLLTHTAGLKYSTMATFAGSRLMDYTRAVSFESASKYPLDFTPGERYQYSDTGYTLLGMIIEEASGRRYLEFLTERIFEPLGMTATLGLLQDQWAIVKNRASLYTWREGKLARARRDWQAEVTGAGGVGSTVKDLAKWDAALYTEKILKKSSLEQMWTPLKLNNGFRHAYGFGWILGKFRGHRHIMHGGATGVNLLRLPDDRLTVIVLTNLANLAGTNSRGIALTVAGHYIPDLLLSLLKERPDPDPQMTQKMRGVLSDIANGVKDSPHMTPGFQQSAASGYGGYPSVRRYLKDLKSFTFLACDDVQEPERFGGLVRRVCYYKAVTPLETWYCWFYLTADGKVADFGSKTE